jgi:exodeoxyribonuclease VII large subunit
MAAIKFTPVNADLDAAPPGHVGVSEVIRGVGTALQRAFPTSLWVKGEVSDYRPSTQGHHYFNLIERLADGSQAVLPCAVWKTVWPQIRQKLRGAGVALCSGQEMLFQGTVRIYDGAGKLTFHVSDVYPEFTLGKIEAQRRAMLARLHCENLVGLNRRLEMPAVPLRVAVLSSRTAAALRDFEEVLSKSGYAFSVLRYEIPVQGPLVERAVCRALEVLALKQAELRIDAVCIVRGGGSATDLGWWNSYGICASIARMPVPVITGIGHDRDRVAADEVAHTAAPTPTAAAELLCSRVRRSEAALQEATGPLAALAMQRLSSTTQAVKTLGEAVAQTTTAGVAKEHIQFCSLRERFTAHACRSLAPHNDALRQFWDSLGRDARRAIRQVTAAVQTETTGLIVAAKQQTQDAARDVAEKVEDVTASSQKQLKDQAEHHVEVKAEVLTLANWEIIEGHKRLRHLRDIVQAYDPVHILRRGFSITLNADGKAVKSAADLAHGETITTRLATGQIVSTVIQTT